MKVRAMLAAVREAMKYATLESAEFGSIHRDTEHGRTQPVRNSAGEIVTEANVTEFIRERVRIHHASWIIGTLEGVAMELTSQFPHSFAGTQYLCNACGKPQSHRSHGK